MLQVKQSRKTAFSILELSLVIMIISVLAIGVMQGGKIVSKVRLASAASLTKSSMIDKIDGLQLWYETTMPQSIDNISKANKEFVSTWYDISGTKEIAHNATAGNAPKYISDAINGLPVLRFDGSNYLGFDISPLSNSDYTMIMVIQRNPDTGKNFFGYSSTPTTGNGVAMRYLDPATNEIRVNHGASSSYDTDVDAYNGVVPNIFVFNYNMNSATATIYKNGTINDGQRLNTLGVPLNFHDTTYYFGRHLTTNYFTGDFAEVIMFNRLLSDIERKDIERYLGKKWGIDVAS